MNKGGVQVVETDPATGAPTGKTSTLTAGGTTVKDATDPANVKEAVYGADKAELKDGSKINTTTAAGNTIVDGANITNVTAGGTKVTDGTNTAVYDANGIRFTDTTGTALPNTPSISQGGINAGGTTITNVGGPTNGKDAANKDYVDSIGAGATTAGLNFTGDNGTKVHRDLGETLTIKGGKLTGLTDNNIGVIEDALTGSLTVKLAKDIDLGKDGSVKAGDTTVNNGGVQVDDGKGNSAVLSTGGTTVKNAAGQEALYGADKSVLKDGLNITTVSAGNISVSNGTNTLKLDAAKGDITGLSNKNLTAADFATAGRAATEEQLKLVSDVQQTTNDFAVRYDADPTDPTKANKENVTLAGSNGTTITNLKGGEISLTSKDAVNGSQLYGTYTAMLDALGGNSAYNSDGTVTAPTYAVNGTDYKNVGAAISALDTGWVLNANGQNSSAIKAGDAVDIGTADSEDNLTVTKTGNKIDFALNKDLKLNTVMATDKITVGTGTNSITLNGATGTLNGLTNKTWNPDNIVSGQAATEDQLSIVNKSIKDNITNVEVDDGKGGTTTINISDVVVNKNPDNTNQASEFLTFNKEGQATTDRLTIAQTVQKMNTEGVKYFHTNADMSKGSLGITNDSSAGGLDSTAIGVNALVDTGADNTIALGRNTRALASAKSAVVLGDNSVVGGASAIAIGDGAQALGNQSISIGKGNIVKGNNSGALGDPSIIDGNNSYSVGNNNTVSTDNTFVLGNDVTQTVEGSVVLGNKSAATTGAGIAGYMSANVTAADKAAILATTSTTGAVAVGNASAGVYRQITGVAAGTADSDAVNVAQLKSVSNQLGEQINNVNNSAVQYDKNPDGTVNKGSITLAGGTDGKGTTITNVKDGDVSSGSKDAVNGGQLADVRDNLQGQINNNTNDINNIKNDINNGTVGLVQQAGASGEVTVAKNTGGTTVNVAGKDGDRVVTGVANGAVNSTSKDAVNGSQLSATNDAVVKYLGGGAAYDNITGSFTAPSYTVGDSKHNNVGGAIDALNQADQALNQKIDNVSTKLDDAFRVTNDRIDNVEQKANAGIAAAMALESAPYIPGKYTYAAGAAYHGGENAVGVTLRKTADNGRWSITGGVAAASQGDPSVRIGISGVID